MDSVGLCVCCLFVMIFLWGGSNVELPFKNFCCALWSNGERVTSSALVLQYSTFESCVLILYFIIYLGFSWGDNLVVSRVPGRAKDMVFVF